MARPPAPIVIVFLTTKASIARCRLWAASPNAAQQKLIQKRKELDTRATGVELPPETEPEPTKESNLAARVEK
jgi:hypothetical protein